MMKLSKYLVHLGLCSSVHSFVASNAPHLSSVKPLYATEVAVADTENPRLSGLALMLDDGTRKTHSMAQNT